WLYIMLGALPQVEEHARLAMSSSHAGSFAWLMGQMNLSWLATVRGATDEAIALARGAYEAAPSGAYMAGVARLAWGYALLRADRLDEVEPHTQEALPLLTGMPPLQALARAQVADLLQCRGRLAEALGEVSAILAGGGSFAVHPMALAYA